MSGTEFSYHRSPFAPLQIQLVRNGIPRRRVDGDEHDDGGVGDPPGEREETRNSDRGGGEVLKIGLPPRKARARLFVVDNVVASYD